MCRIQSSLPDFRQISDRFQYVPSWQVFHVLESPPWQAAPSQTFDHEYIIVNETQDVSQGFSPGFMHSSRHSRGSAAQSAQEDPVNVSQEDPISDSDSQETLDDMARHMQAQAQPQQAQSVSPGFSLGFRHSSSRGPAAQSAQEDRVSVRNPISKVGFQYRDMRGKERGGRGMGREREKRRAVSHPLPTRPDPASRPLIYSPSYD